MRFVEPVFRPERAWLLVLVGMLILSLFSPAASALTLTDVPLPHGTRVEVISSNTVHNGNRLSLATYESSLSLEDTADFYRGVWADSPDEELPGMIETRTEQWLMLSRVRDGYNTVIQLSLAEPYRGRGLLSIMSLSATDTSGAQAMQGYGADIPGLQLLSSTESDDGARSSVMSVYLSNESVEATSEHFARFLTSQKWSLVSVRDYQKNKVMLLNRPSSQIELVIGDNDDQGTIVVLNEVTNRG